MAEGLYIYHEGHEQEHQQVMRGLKEAADMIVSVNGRMKALHDGLKGAGFAGQAQGMREWATLAREATRCMNELTEALRKNAEAARGAGSAASKGVGTMVKEFAEAVKMGREFSGAIDKAGGSTKSFGGFLKSMGTALLSWHTALVAGIALLISYSDEIGDFIMGVSKADKALKKASENAIDSYTSEATHLNVLNQELGNTEISTRRLHEIRDEMIRAYPGLAQNLQGEENLQYRLANSINVVTEALKIQAQIKGAEQVIADETAKYLKGEWATSDYLEYSFKSLYMPTAVALASTTASIVTEHQKTIDKMYSYIEKKQEELRTKGLDQVFSTPPETPQRTSNGDGRKKRIDVAAETEAANERVTKAIAERNKIVLEDEIKTQQLIYDNEQETVDKRYAAWSKIYSSKMGLLEINYQAETQITREKLADIDRIEKKAYRDRTDEERKLLIQKKAFQEEHATATKKYLSGLKDLQHEADKEILDSQKDLDSELEKAMADHVAEITEWTNQKNKERIAKEKETVDQLQQIEKDLQRQKYELAKQGAEEISRLLDRLANADRERFDKEKERLLEKQELENLYVDSQLLTEEEKAERKLAIAKDVQNREDEIEKRKRANEQKWVQIQKAAALLKLYIDMQARIADLKLTAAHYTSKQAYPLAAGALAQIPYVIASTGIAVAGILAQNLPSFAVGTDNSPEGFAKVGEKGTEAIITPDGKLNFTPNQATIAYLPEGTQVIPHEETKALVAMSSSLGMSPANMAMLLQKEKGGSSMSNKELVQGLKRVENAINNKTEHHWSWKNGDLKHAVKKGNAWTEYLTKNVFE